MLPRFYDVVTDAAGNSIAGASVAITTWKGAPASLFSNRTGTASLPSTLTTDARGQFSFYAASGHYIVTTTVGGFSPDTREISLGSGDEFAPEYFGIFPGTTNDITSAVQTWIDELVGASHTAFPSGWVQSGAIDLPWLDATLDSVICHPAISIYGNSRGGTRLTMKANATPVNIGTAGLGQAAMIYYVARAISGNGPTAWMPEVRNLRLIGNSGNQGGLPAHGILAERTDNDNSSGGGFSSIGYSSFLLYNVDIYKFSGHCVWVQRGRQRTTVGGRTRATSAGLWDSTNGLITSGSGFRIEGDQPVMTDFGAGFCTAYSVDLSAVSGSLINGANIWGPESGARSNTAVALRVYQSNGFSITNTVFNDTVVIDGAQESDRSSEFSGNQFKPNDVVFTSDGVTAGTADEQHNCHILVRNSKNITIGSSGFGAGGSTGYRYLDILHVASGANIHADFASSSFYDLAGGLAVKPWASTRDVPILVYDVSEGTTCTYSFTDVNRTATWANTTQAGVEDANQIFTVKTTPNSPQVTLPGDQDNYLKFAGTVDTLTIQLPEAPIAGAIYSWTTANQILNIDLVLTSAAISAGHNLQPGTDPSGLAAGESFALVFRPSVMQWWAA